MSDHQRQADPREELVERLFESTLHGLEVMNVYLGDVLGLYRTLQAGGPATAPELAERAGIAQRYAQEWLEGQAASGFLTVDDAGAAPLERLATGRAARDRRAVRHRPCRNLASYARAPDLSPRQPRRDGRTYARRSLVRVQPMMPG